MGFHAPGGESQTPGGESPGPHAHPRPLCPYSVCAYVTSACAHGFVCDVCDAGAKACLFLARFESDGPFSGCFLERHPQLLRDSGGGRRRGHEEVSTGPGGGGVAATADRAQPAHRSRGVSAPAGSLGHVPVASTENTHSDNVGPILVYQTPPCVDVVGRCNPPTRPIPHIERISTVISRCSVLIAVALAKRRPVGRSTCIRAEA